MNITHPIQKEIILQLLKNPKSRFRDLNQTDLTNDHFTFHLKRLQTLQLIEKKDSYYQLTSKGLEIAGRLDIDSGLFVTSPKVGVSLFISRNNNGEEQVLLEKRKVDPNKGLWGFHSEKVKLGESLFTSCNRCLEQEIGLTGNLEFAGSCRIVRYNKDQLIMDVLLNYFRVKNPVGELNLETDHNYNKWFSVDSLPIFSETFPNFDKDLKLYQNNQVFFEERIEK